MLEKKTFLPESDNTNYTASSLFTANDKVKKNSDVLCLFCTKNHKTQSWKVVTHVETRKNIKDKKCRLACLKGIHISKNCTNKIQCYKCSKRHNIALCDFEQNKNNKVPSQINDSNETSYNFISLILQTAIATVGNDSFQYHATISFNNGSQSSYTTSTLCEKLNLKSIASRDITIRVFGIQVLQEKLDCIRVCLKSTDNENIVINCLVKDNCQPLHGQDLLHAKQKFKRLKNLKLADNNSNDENFCVNILIDSNFLWDIFESETI